MQTGGSKDIFIGVFKRPYNVMAKAIAVRSILSNIITRVIKSRSILSTSSIAPGFSPGFYYKHFYKKSRYGAWFKAIAVVLVCAFLTTNLAWASPSDNSIPINKNTLAAQSIFDALEKEGIENSARLVSGILLGLGVLVSEGQIDEVNGFLTQMYNERKIIFDRDLERSGNTLKAKFTVADRKNVTFEVTYTKKGRGFGDPNAKSPKPATSAQPRTIEHRGVFGNDVIYITKCTGQPDLSSEPATSSETPVSSNVIKFPEQKPDTELALAGAVRAAPGAVVPTAVPAAAGAPRIEWMVPGTRPPGTMAPHLNLANYRERRRDRDGNFIDDNGNIAEPISLEGIDPAIREIMSKINQENFKDFLEIKRSGGSCSGHVEGLMKTLLMGYLSSLWEESAPPVLRPIIACFLALLGILLIPILIPIFLLYEKVMFLFYPAEIKDSRDVFFTVVYKKDEMDWSEKTREFDRALCSIEGERFGVRRELHPEQPTQEEGGVSYTYAMQVPYYFRKNCGTLRDFWNEVNEVVDKFSLAAAAGAVQAADTELALAGAVGSETKAGATDTDSVITELSGDLKAKILGVPNEKARQAFALVTRLLGNAMGLTAGEIRRIVSGTEVRVVDGLGRQASAGGKIVTLNADCLRLGTEQGMQYFFEQAASEFGHRPHQLLLPRDTTCKGVREAYDRISELTLLALLGKLKEEDINTLKRDVRIGQLYLEFRKHCELKYTPVDDEGRNRFEQDEDRYAADFAFFLQTRGVTDPHSAVRDLFSTATGKGIFVVQPAHMEGAYVLLELFKHCTGKDIIELSKEDILDLGRLMISAIQNPDDVDFSSEEAFIDSIEAFRREQAGEGRILRRIVAFAAGLVRAIKVKILLARVKSQIRNKALAGLADRISLGIEGDLYALEGRIRGIMGKASERAQEWLRNMWETKIPIRETMELKKSHSVIQLKDPVLLGIEVTSEAMKFIQAEISMKPSDFKIFIDLEKKEPADFIIYFRQDRNARINIFTPYLYVLRMNGFFAGLKFILRMLVPGIFGPKRGIKKIMIPDKAIRGLVSESVAKIEIRRPGTGAIKTAGAVEAAPKAGAMEYTDGETIEDVRMRLEIFIDEFGGEGERVLYNFGKGLTAAESPNEEVWAKKMENFADIMEKLTSSIPVIIDWAKYDGKPPANLPLLSQAVDELTTNASDSIVSFYDPEVTLNLLKDSHDVKNYEGKITISFKLLDDDLEIIVGDNGMGKDGATSDQKKKKWDFYAGTGEGRGSAIVNEFVNRLGSIKLEKGNAKTKRTKAILRVPLKMLACKEESLIMPAPILALSEPAGAVEAAPRAEATETPAAVAGTVVMDGDESTAARPEREDEMLVHSVARQGGDVVGHMRGIIRNIKSNNPKLRHTTSTTYLIKERPVKYITGIGIAFSPSDEGKRIKNLAAGLKDLHNPILAAKNGEKMTYDELSKTIIDGYTGINEVHIEWHALDAIDGVWYTADLSDQIEADLQFQAALIIAMLRREGLKFDTEVVRIEPDGNWTKVNLEREKVIKGILYFTRSKSWEDLQQFYQGSAELELIEELLNDPTFFGENVCAPTAELPTAVVSTLTLTAARAGATKSEVGSVFKFNIPPARPYDMGRFEREYKAQLPPAFFDPRDTSPSPENFFSEAVDSPNRYIRAFAEEGPYRSIEEFVRHERVYAYHGLRPFFGLPFQKGTDADKVDEICSEAGQEWALTLKTGKLLTSSSAPGLLHPTLEYLLDLLEQKTRAIFPDLSPDRRQVIWMMILACQAAQINFEEFFSSGGKNVQDASPFVFRCSSRKEWALEGIFDSLDKAKEVILLSHKNLCYAKVTNEPTIRDIKALSEIKSIEVGLVKTKQGDWRLYKGFEKSVSIPTSQVEECLHTHPTSPFPSDIDKKNAETAEYVISEEGVCIYAGEFAEPILVKWEDLEPIASLPVSELRHFFIEVRKEKTAGAISRKEERRIYKQCNSAASMLAQADEYLEDHPVNMDVDLKDAAKGLEKDEAQKHLGEIMEIMADLILAHRARFKFNIRYAFDIDEAYRGEAMNILKKRLTDRAVIHGISPDEALSSIGPAHTGDDTITVQLKSLEEIKRMAEQNAQVGDRVYPVAFKVDNVKEGTSIPNIIAAGAIGLLLAGLRVVKDESSKADYETEVAKVVRKFKSILQRTGVLKKGDTNFTKRVLDLMVTGKSATKLLYAELYALPPMVTMSIDKLKAWYEKIKLVIQSV